MGRVLGVWLTAFAVLLLSVPVDGAPTAGARPELSVSAPTFGCPEIAGAFVVLLDPARGMLLLSGAEFPGGHQVGQASGGSIRVALKHSGAWELSRAGSGTGSVAMWGAAYRVSTGGIGGCVAFDRDQFSSEGDVVTYAQWLINDVYIKLPKAERERFPALRLATRVVRLRVQFAGYQPAVLQDSEGATMALRVPGGPQTLLLRAFVLDETTGRLAIDLSITDQPYWETAQKRPLGFVVASVAQPAALTDPALTIQVEVASAQPAGPGQPH